MIDQTVLPFKLEITRDEITAHAGLALFGEFLRAMAVGAEEDRALPSPGSGAGYRPSQFIEPLLLMLHGGGRTLEDLRQIREDAGLRDLLGMESIPSADAVGDWLRRTGAGVGLERQGLVNCRYVRRALRRDERSKFTLDIDATQIVAEKQEAQKTYKGERGYMPIMGHLAENGLVVGDEFRAGNESPGSRNLEFIQYCAAQMPKGKPAPGGLAGKRIAHLRSDSAAYQASIFNWCEDENVSFAIGADLDEAVQASIAEIPEADWRPYQDGHIAETVHSMEKTKKAFRLIVIRRPSQGELFGPDDLSLRYTVIASNREESTEATVAWYNRRGECSENRIKELKIGFGLERMPCGQFTANAMFFRIGVLAYNLFVLFKMDVLPAGWRTHQVQTIRWRLYQTAGKVVHHAGALILKVRRWMFGLLEEIRARCTELARA